MREILFRDKRVDNGEWEYGDLINDGTGTICILPQIPDSEFVAVIPDKWYEEDIGKKIFFRREEVEKVIKERDKV